MHGETGDFFTKLQHFHLPNILYTHIPYTVDIVFALSDDTGVKELAIIRHL